METRALRPNVAAVAHITYGCLGRTGRETLAHGQEWENLYFKFAEMNKEVNVRNPSGSSRAKKLGKVRDAKERCDAYEDHTREERDVCERK